jgi:hypothetical protein
MNQQKFIQSYTDLCGSVFLTLESGLNLEQVKIAFESLHFETLSTAKLRILFDGYEPEDIQNLLETLAPNYSVNTYSTNFFHATRSDLEKKVFVGTDLDWELYRQSFLITEVTAKSHDHIAVLKDFLITSFATCQDKSKTEFGKTNTERRKEILDNFENNFSNLSQKTFCVSSKTGKIVGFFSLYNVFEEVQLAGVAGLTTLDAFVFRDSPKLPILCAAIVNEFYTNEFFAFGKSLNFSNSKDVVAKKYSELGFETSNSRKGLFLVLK